MIDCHIYCFRPCGSLRSCCHRDDIPVRGRRQQTHVMGCGDCFTIEGGLINIRAETWRKWGRVPDRRLAGNVLGPREWPVQGRSVKGVLTVILTLERLTNALLFKVLIYLTSCKVFSHSKNLKFTACLSIVIFYIVTFMPSLHDDYKIAHLLSPPQVLIFFFII